MDGISNFTFERIHEYCKEEEQQLRIVAIATRIDKQGLTQLFINPKKVRTLAAELVNEHVLRADYDLTQFEPEKMHTILVEFLTRKVASYMEQKGEVVDNESCSAKFNETVIALIVSPRNAHVMFSWLSEFTFQYTEEIGNALNQHRSNLNAYDRDVAEARISMDAVRQTWELNERNLARLSELYDEALPCGMVHLAEYKLWLNKRDIEFRDFDVTPLTEWMPFERYYVVAFNNVPTKENRIKGWLQNKKYFELSPDVFKGKEELRIEIDEMFRSFVYDDIKNSFIIEDEFYEADLSEHVRKMKKDKDLWVCFLYLAAMVRVSYVECQRLDKLLTGCKG